MVLTLPWPPAQCNPNKRLHWSRVARAKRAYRSECHSAALKAGLNNRRKKLFKPPLKVHIEICPPDRRRRDMDNVIASFKSGQDGVADIIGIDDFDWVVSYSMGDIVKGGAIRVTLGEKR